MDKLSEKNIISKLSSPHKIIILNETSSTNDIAKKLAKNGEVSGCVIIAERQTCGRGRNGKAFYSPDSGLYLSMIVRPDLNINQAVQLTATAAVSVAESIENVTGKEAAIKWVNDIYIDKKKVCGILCECDTLGDSVNFVIIGIGVNLTSPPQGFPEDIKSRAGTIFKTNAPQDIKNRLSAEIINNLDRLLKTDHVEILKQYRHRSMIIGKEIQISGKNSLTKACAVSINDNFELIVKNETGEMISLSSGEVSILV